MRLSRLLSRLWTVAPSEVPPKPTVGFSMPTLESRISIGNVIAIVVGLVNLGSLIIAVGIGWGTLQERNQTTERAITSIEAELAREAASRKEHAKQMDDRVRVLENAQARADEKFNSVLQVLGRIEARLERLDTQ